MTKSTSTKQGKSKAAPDKFSKTGKKSGIELTEADLGQASGGAAPLKLKIDF